MAGGHPLDNTAKEKGRKKGKKGKTDKELSEQLHMKFIDALDARVTWVRIRSMVAFHRNAIGASLAWTRESARRNCAVGWMATAHAKR